MSKVLIKGNEAIAEAAIQAGCRFFFGYPITPQNEIPEYMAYRMPQVGGCFLQAESELAAINMVYGASGAGARVMTSSSSPGISLKQEGISFMATVQLPCVVVNMVRGGPGLGSIQPSQGDYFQATKGGGHGDYHVFVLAPASVQEAADMVMEGFDIADQYRIPVMILGDGMIGQMMEPVEFKVPPKRDLPEKTWASTGWRDQAARPRSIINSLYITGNDLEQINLALQEKYAEITANEVRWEEYECEGAEIIVAAYGTVARIMRNVIALAKKEGIRVGLIRPKTLWPFPAQIYAQAAQWDSVRSFLCVEMSAGQMVEDVRLAVGGIKPVHFYGRLGGAIPEPSEILSEIKKIREGE
ncbi:MAG: 3-methyl-2-oxobutanoate dehydrogenase subunit VorB [Christensenellales bacterium]|jgi:2-oxoglutarate ferredoxin oxidoreductase subunit alpha